jgi:EAL domain-containing protein (putative c-di-GMP-specific phosphodiesterase class I)
MDGAIVESINRIGHVAGIRTIAEFVETEAVRARLAELGVDYAQGYAIERPRACAPDAEAANDRNLNRQDARDAKIE